MGRLRRLFGRNALFLRTTDGISMHSVSPLIETIEIDDCGTLSPPALARFFVSLGASSSILADSLPSPLLARINELLNFHEVQTSRVV